MASSRAHTVASLIVVGTGILWGVYWVPVRRLAEAALGGAWGSLAIVAAATVVLLPFAVRGRRRSASRHEPRRRRAPGAADPRAGRRDAVPRGCCCPHPHTAPCVARVVRARAKASPRPCLSAPAGRLPVHGAVSGETRPRSRDRVTGRANPARHRAAAVSRRPAMVHAPGPGPALMRAACRRGRRGASRTRRGSRGSTRRRALPGHRDRTRRCGRGDGG